MALFYIDVRPLRQLVALEQDDPLTKVIFCFCQQLQKGRESLLNVQEFKSKSPKKHEDIAQSIFLCMLHCENKCTDAREPPPRSTQRTPTHSKNP